MSIKLTAYPFYYNMNEIIRKGKCQCYSTKSAINPCKIGSKQKNQPKQIDWIKFCGPTWAGMFYQVRFRLYGELLKQIAKELIMFSSSFGSKQKNRPS